MEEIILRRIITSRMIVIVVCYIVAFFGQVSSSGEFQVNLLSFINDNGRTTEGSCCSGPRGDITDEVSSPEQSNTSCPPERTCRTYFRVCLSHYQASIPLNGPCTWAERETDAIANNSFVWRTRGEAGVISDVNLTAANVIRLPFKFSWPGSYSIVIEAWHHDHSQDESKPKRLPEDLIHRFAIQQLLKPIQTWNYTESSNPQSKLDFSYRVTCDKDYYGEGCEVLCINRNDKFGHFRCNPGTGSRVCLDGWTGEYCDKVVCSSACHPVHSTGICVRPNECQCRMGWQGKQCDQCIRYPGCKRGTCQKPWQCNCDEGWGGQFCNQDLNFCINHKPCMNGAACINSGQGSYTCSCKEGFTGTNCEIKLAVCEKETCLNNGICQLSMDGRTSQCKCPAGFYGRRCEAEAVNSCREGSCGNGATCQTISATQYRCLCPVGYNGSHCEVEIDECQSHPCLNGGRCVDDVGSFQCVCPRGFTGAVCQQNINDCALSPCLHDATCRDKIDDFECICHPGYTGALCQDHHDVDACTQSPCANGAACRTTPSNGGFRCICPSGFTGRLCEVDVNDCQPGHCLNGGTCIDLINDFECVCAHGYHGNRCDNDDRRTGISSEIIDNEPNQSTYKAVIGASVNKSETLTLKQIVLVVGLGVGLSVVLLALAVTLLVLRRRRRLARVKRDNLKNETKFLNNRQVYPGDENVQIAFADKIYTKNAITFDVDRRTDAKSCHHAQVHEWKKVSQNTCNKLSRKEVNSITTNIPLLLNECGGQHSFDSLRVNESSKDVHRKYKRDDVNEKSNNHLESLLNLDRPHSHIPTTVAATDIFSFSTDV